MRRVGGTNRNWAHSERFDSDAMVEFEERLGRARTANRAGYLRVKAATLLDLAHPTATAVAVQLLHRVVDNHDDFIEVPWSHELLGNVYLDSGDLAAAERHLRLAISSADDRRNGLSLPELTLAEVLLQKVRSMPLKAFSTPCATCREEWSGIRSCIDSLWPAHVAPTCQGAMHRRGPEKLSTSPATRSRSSLDIPRSALSRRTPERSPK